MYALRHYHELPNNKVSHSQTGVVTLPEAAHRLGVSTSSVRRMIELKLIPAAQAVECAPWESPEGVLQSDDVQRAARNTKNRVRILPQAPGVWRQSWRRHRMISTPPQDAGEVVDTERAC